MLNNLIVGYIVDAIKSDQIAYREKTEVGRFVEDYIKTEKINPDTLRESTGCRASRRCVAPELR